MKYLRRFNEEKQNENWSDIGTYFLIGVLLYKFLRGFLLDRLGKSIDEKVGFPFENTNLYSKICVYLLLF